MTQNPTFDYSKTVIIFSDDRTSRSAKRSLRPFAHLLAGASAGLTTAILTSPLDVLRTRLQSDLYHFPPGSIQGVHSPSKPTIRHLLSASLRHVRETVQIINFIHNTEGWRGFFRGLGPSLAGVVPATAVKFYTYGNCKRLSAHILNCREDAVIVQAQAAVAAGIATATATNPIWLVKTRLQLDRSRTEGDGNIARRYRNSLDCVRQIIQKEGIRGMYRGLSASYLGTVETMLHLVLYEQLKVTFHRSLEDINTLNNKTWDEVAKWISTSGAAGSAKLAAVLITYPHEACFLMYDVFLTNAPLGGQDKITASSDRKWDSEIHWPLAVFSIDRETGRVIRAI